MKNIFKMLALTGALILGMNAFAIFPQDTKNQVLYGIANAADPLPGIGSIINATKNMMRVTYDFAVLTGSNSGNSFNLVDDHGNLAYLPKGAIVTNVVANVITAMVGTSSVALQVLTTADLMASKAPTTQLASGFVAGVPVGTAGTWVGPITATAGTQVVFTANTSGLTAGKVEWFIEYVIQ